MLRGEAPGWYESLQLLQCSPWHHEPGRQDCSTQAAAMWGTRPGSFISPGRKNILLYRSWEVEEGRDNAITSEWMGRMAVPRSTLTAIGVSHTLH